MSTRMDGVWIHFQLDVSDAIRQLDQIEKYVRSIGGNASAISSNGINAPSQNMRGPSMVQPPRGITPPPAQPLQARRILQLPQNAANAGMAHRMVAPTPTAQPQNQAGNAIGAGARAVQAIGGNAPAGNAQASNGIQNAIAAYLARRLGITGGGNPISNTLISTSGTLNKISGSTAFKSLVGVASVYGAVRTVALGAPIALEAGRSASGLSQDDPLFKAVQDQLGNLRNSVNYLESYVKSAVTGIGKTYDMATAMARVNGKVPNLTIGYGIYREADLQEDMLQKKFEEFKQREVVEAVATSMVDFFKGGINR